MVITWRLPWPGAAASGVLLNAIHTPRGEKCALPATLCAASSCTWHATVLSASREPEDWAAEALKPDLSLLGASHCRCESRLGQSIALQEACTTQ